MLFVCMLSFFELKAAQKYFMLDEKSPQYQLARVQLKSSNDQPIALYNLMYEKSNLILFSLLPVNGKELWQEIDFEKVKNQLIDFTQLKSLFSEGYQIYLNSGSYNSEHIKRQDITLLINKGGKYYAGNFCLSEYFTIVDQKMVFPNLMGNVVINILSPTISVSSFESKYFEAWGYYSPNSISERNTAGATALHRPLEKPLLFRSGETEILNHKAYRFWQFTDWRIDHGINYHRGIDRFLFVPNIGIVAGSFDAFFAKNLNKAQQEYLQEKMFLPEKAEDIVVYK